jgi:hypothetical protein
MNKLLPYRNKQTNFFICDIADTFKDDMASMEHPIFSLNKAIDLRVLRYERNNVVIEVSPSAKGLATIYDKDILLYQKFRKAPSLQVGDVRNIGVAPL